MTGTITRSELIEDVVSSKEIRNMVESLAREAKVVRGQIAGIEAHAGEVTDPALIAAAERRVGELRNALYGIIARATHEHYTPEDVRRWAEHSVAKGGRFPVFDTKVIRALGLIHKVPNCHLREAVLDLLEEGTSSYTDIIRTTRERLVEREREVGEDLSSDAWDCSSDKATKNSIASLQGQLGMRPISSRGSVSCVFLMRYELAVAISQAIGLNPIQAGV
jgi:hypothetical protein